MQKRIFLLKNELSYNYLSTFVVVNIICFMTTTDFRLRLKMLIDTASVHRSIQRKLPYIDGIIDGTHPITLDDILIISKLLEVPPYLLFLQDDNLFEKYGISLEELEDMTENNGSLRGTLIGYLAEKKLRQLLESDKRITIKGKPDDHDRKEKCDLIIQYKGKDFRFESKSLQTNNIKPSTNPKYELTSTVQCDASDCRAITLPNGDTVVTTCLQYGGFDILAVNMFMFHQEWEFAFAINEDLPHSTYKGGKKQTISDDALQYLMKTSIPITYPIDTPFVSDPCMLLDELMKRRGD